MRILLALAGIAALGWGGYWFVGAMAMERAMTTWLDERRADGWQADAGKVETRGFPNRFDTTLTGVHLADPVAGFYWTAPFFQVLSLSYKPHHIIAVLPQAHSFSTPDETIEIRSTESRGSLVFLPNSKLELELDRSSFVVTDSSFASTNGWSVSARSMQIATRQSVGAKFGHDLAFDASDLVVDGDWSEIARNAGLPDKIAGLKIDMTIAFDAPWDRFAIEKARPQPRLLDVKSMRAEWGELLFQLTGTLDVDKIGVPTGSIAVQAQNWREMLDLAILTGAIHPDLRPTIEGALALVAGMSGNADHIDATINFRNGFMAIGPFPIGPAPRFRIR